MTPDVLPASSSPTPDRSVAAPAWLPVAAWMAGAVLFTLLVTANGGGYRYGVSDQAFYIPVVTRALDPAAFPRDGSLIDGQGRLMLTDELIAAVVRATGLPLDVLFFGGYLLSVACIWGGATLIGARLYRSRWTMVALAAALTLRHRIPRTSANSFEPYFHPRMLAFGLGLLAIAAVLRRRPWTAILLVGVSALVHVTTALWFAVLIGVALMVLDRTLRRLAWPALAAMAVVSAWLLIGGPLRASMTSMDERWLQAVATKDSLFASTWPLWAWLANLGMFAVLIASAIYRGRGRAPQSEPLSEEERALLWGAVALVAVFLVTLPAVTLHLALPVQLQISRVFWLIDLLATIYLLALVDGRRAGRAIAALLLLFSIGRAIYVMQVERPERALFAIHLPESPWQDAMRWIARQDVSAHILADPGHAWKYGTSVRVAAGRDVFLEDVKDSAIAIYSRDVAERVVDRAAAIGDFSQLTAERASELARHYDLDYLVTEADLPLPLTYRNGQFRAYALTTRAPR